MTEHPYYPELDAFRAGAILLVIISHWFPALLVPIDLGGIGVTAFFVLSGFLITNILRRASTHGGFRGKVRFAYVFYSRRALRLLPAYYCALALAWGLKLTYVREAWPWFALHGTNIFLFNQRHWGEGIGHFWSLAVEEQFYLFWPVLVLLLSYRRLAVALILLIGLGPMARWWLWQRTGTTFSFILLPACLDLFAVGGGLSLLLRNTPVAAWVWGRATLVGGSLYWLLARGPSELFLVLGPTCLAFTAACTIAMLLNARATFPRRILHSPLLVVLGRVSYGLYLYHLFVPIILHRLLHHLGSRIANGRFYAVVMGWEATSGGILMMTGLVLLLTLSSWVLIEQPFRRLQRFFPY